MKIGIISDTHNLLRPEVYRIFEGVDLILHAGDIGERDILIELEAIAPVLAVLGNNDYGLSLNVKKNHKLRLNNFNVLVQHIFKEIPDPNQSSQKTVENILVFGHSHKPFNHQIGDTLYFNPGSAGPRRFNLPITLGRIELLDGRIKSEIVSLEEEGLA